MLLAAGRALVDQAPPMVVGRRMAAALAAKAPRPALREQIGPAWASVPNRARNEGRSRGSSSGTIATSMFLLRSLYPGCRIRQPA